MLRRGRDTDAEDNLALGYRDDFFVPNELQDLLIYKLAAQLRQEVAVTEHRFIESLFVLEIDSHPMRARLVVTRFDAALVVTSKLIINYNNMHTRL